jgi:membrane-associated phospholipid phosphatase
VPVLLHPQRTFLPAGLILNTTPSGHVAWALLLFWFAYRYCRKSVAVIFGAILFLTIIATLGLGEHYVIDLIVAVPYAAAIWALVEKQWQRGGAFLAIVIAWLLALRQGWAIPIPAPIMWLLCAATILASLPWHELRPSPYASN